MAPPFPLSNRATVVRPSCRTQRIAPTLRQVANLVCAPIKETEYFQTCRGADGGARAHDRRVPADLRADSQATVPPTPLRKKEIKERVSGRSVLKEDEEVEEEEEEEEGGRRREEGGGGEEGGEEVGGKREQGQGRGRGGREEEDGDEELLFVLLSE
ncbi:hypothetical protein PoB_000698300 [Plakobranchus ocellatus]|uniref:Uncharacterized protein n=1 Tax=Plakobranchus ocellatus TaxID=259542 RepID=A0AAV3YDB0_9GAST|nr:hypothetical protein PoB_000698300 [Plakobranchus ocellatus]